MWSGFSRFDRFTRSIARSRLSRTSFMPCANVWRFSLAALVIQTLSRPPRNKRQSRAYSRVPSSRPRNTAAGTLRTRRPAGPRASQRTTRSSTRRPATSAAPPGRLSTLDSSSSSSSRRRQRLLLHPQQPRQRQARSVRYRPEDSRPRSRPMLTTSRRTRTCPSRPSTRPGACSRRRRQE